jgi:hypothetical protein
LAVRLLISRSDRPRAATADEEAVAARDENIDSAGTSVVEDVEQAGEAILGGELSRFIWVRVRSSTAAPEFGVQHLLVELLVALVQLLELAVALDECIEFRLRLPFEHGILLQHMKRRPGRGLCESGTGRVRMAPWSLE